METVVNRKLYEGMFLVDSAQAADWDATKAVLEGVLKRANAEVVEMKKWDDRRLAYEVDKKARGAYILCYFHADCDKIQEVEKGVQLSEQIMRVLILSTEQMSDSDMKQDTPVVKAEKEAAAAEEARAARAAEAVAKAAEAAEQEGSDAPADESAPVEAAEAAPVAEAAEAAAPVESDEAAAPVPMDIGKAAEDNAAVSEAEESDKPVPMDIGKEVKEPVEAEASDAGEASAETESEESKE